VNVAEADSSIALRSSEDVELFLADKPREWAEILAARAALRVFPLLCSVFKSVPRNGTRFTPADIVLTLLRGAALPWLAALVPSHGQRLRKAAARAAAATTASASASRAPARRASARARAVRAFARAADVARSADSPAAAYAAANTISAAARVHAALEVLSRDAASLASYSRADSLRSVRLWHSGAVPDFVADRWAELSNALLQADGASDWSLIWIDWYEAIRDGRAPWGLTREMGEQILVEAMLWPQEEWDKGALHINRRIARLIEAARAKEIEAVSDVVPEPIPSRRDPLPPLPPQLPDPQPASRDFFVSYCHVDEAMAREVVDVVEGLGFAAFAQFRDMGPGSNFVREMQRSLATSSRVIALYSPDYEASHQCQAEWSAAYNADPGGEKRKLLPFLLRPTRLNPLAQQIVYKSLVGLSVAERRAAIIEAIEHRSGASTMGATVAALAASASPDVAFTASGRIDIAPNIVFDRAVLTSTLIGLPKRQRVLCQQIIQFAPGNTPPMFTGSFKIYERHLRGGVDRISPGLLEGQWQVASAYLVGPEAIAFDVGLTKALEIFAQNHSEIVTHFPMREDRERLLSETPIDEQAAAGGALTDPIESVRQAVEAAAEADQVTPALVEHVGDLANRAEALAPPPAPAANEPSAIVSPRRRLVLTSLGFFERLYAAVGSTASVLSTETGRALYNAAREAADALMRFIR
jgi:hypothetical protein